MSIENNFQNVIAEQLEFTGVDWNGFTTTSVEVTSPEEDAMDLQEEVVIEREYDDHGNVTKETRSVYRPRERKLEPPVRPVVPRKDRGGPSQPQQPSPWVPQPYPPYQPQPWWGPNTYPGRPLEVWCGTGMRPPDNDYTVWN